MTKKVEKMALNEAESKAIEPVNINEIIELIAQEPKEIGTRGTFSEHILERKKESEEEKELRYYKQLQTYKKDGEILWGTVNGVEKIIIDNKPHCYISVLWNGIKVSIPDDYYFEKDYFFGKSYDSGSEEEKFSRRRQIASYNQGAMVCFCVKATTKELIEEGQFKGEYLISAVGDRNEAMRKLQDIYFFHKNRKTSQEPIIVKKGDIMSEVHVLGVKEDKVTVECCGVEVKLDAYRLSNNYIENCNDFCKVGDTLTLTVKNVSVKDDKVNLVLTGRTFETSKNIVSMKPDSFYFGYVTSYKKDKDMYVVTLANGVIANVYGNKVEGNLVLAVGDRVSVFVYSVLSNYVLGTARKC